jgi:hypothetical protein
VLLDVGPEPKPAIAAEPEQPHLPGCVEGGSVESACCALQRVGAILEARHHAEMAARTVDGEVMEVG